MLACCIVIVESCRFTRRRPFDSSVFIACQSAKIIACQSSLLVFIACQSSLLVNHAFEWQIAKIVIVRCIARRCPTSSCKLLVNHAFEFKISIWVQLCQNVMGRLHQNWVLLPTLQRRSRGTQKVAFYIGETQLTEGRIADVALMGDTEVQAVTAACNEKAVKVLVEAVVAT